MNLWQARFDIVSREMICVTTKQYKTTWDSVTQPLVCNDEFAEFFKKSSGSSKLVIFGNADGTCVGINCTGGCVRDVFCCIDSRCIDMDELEIICDFICDNDAYIVKGDTIYPPEPQILHRLVMQSEAYRFAQNPSCYLARFMSVDKTKLI